MGFDVKQMFPGIERDGDFMTRDSPERVSGLTYEFTNTDFVHVTCHGGGKR